MLKSTNPWNKLTLAIPKASSPKIKIKEPNCTEETKSHYEQ
jgi:hypothetical protein